MVLAAVITVATVLSGCSPNAGSAAGADFHTVISDEAGVTDVRISATNNLPFSGSVTATVTVQDDVSDERVEELTDLIGEYIAEHDTPRTDSSAVQLQIGSFTLSVGGIRADNDQLRELYCTLRSSDSIVGARLASYTVIVEVAGENELISGYDATAVLLADAAFAPLTVTAGTDGFELSGGEERIRPDTAIDAFTAAAAAFDLAGASLTPQAFGLQLRQQADVAPATAFIAALPYAASLGTVTVTIDPVTVASEYDLTDDEYDD